MWWLLFLVRAPAPTAAALLAPQVDTALELGSYVNPRMKNTTVSSLSEGARGGANRLAYKVGLTGAGPRMGKHASELAHSLPSLRQLGRRVR